MFVIGAAVITFTGLVDDVIPDVQARQKIGGQLFAAAALTSTRVGIDLTETLYGLLNIYPSATVVYFSATFLVAFIVLGGCNAINLIDGLDGLSSGVVAIAMVSFLAIALVAAGQPEGGALMADHPNRVVMALATLGAIVGFLPFNWNPATIFMGDAGSLLLGFLAVSAILLMGDVGNYSLKLVTASSPTPLWPSCGVSSAASLSSHPTANTCTTCCGGRACRSSSRSSPCMAAGSCSAWSACP